MAVYFVKSVNTGMVKIGFTATSVDRRVRAIESSSGSRVDILAVVDGGRDFEQELHRQLAAHRHLGEWFTDCDDLRSLMASAVASKGSPADESGGRQNVVATRLDEDEMIALEKRIARLGCDKGNFVRMAIRDKLGLSKDEP